MNNYYPNYYPAYNNGINSNAYNQLLNNPPQINNNISNLNGKIVDSIEVVKATEVPIGGYGIFPKADLNEVYVKTWNNNGTTNIITFKPEIQEGNSEQNQNPLELIMQRLSSLEEKIDGITALPNNQLPPVTKEIKEKAEKEFKF